MEKFLLLIREDLSKTRLQTEEERLRRHPDNG
jgi:hypothetical protein